jgi:hypothetical protein
MANVLTTEQFYAWIKSHSDQDFWDFYNLYIDHDLTDLMTKHAEYLIECENDTIRRMEQRAGA